MQNALREGRFLYAGDFGLLRPPREEQADERNRREATLGHLRDETDAIDAMRDKPDNLFKEALITRMVRATRDFEFRVLALLELYARAQPASPHRRLIAQRSSLCDNVPLPRG